MTQMKYLTLIIPLVILTGCREELNIEVPTKKDILISDQTVFRTSNRIVPLYELETITLASNSTKAKYIYKWIRNNSNGWSRSIVSFVSGYTWEINDYKFNMLDELIIVKHDGNQLTHDLNDTTINFIRRLF